MFWVFVTIKSLNFFYMSVPITVKWKILRPLTQYLISQQNHNDLIGRYFEFKLLVFTIFFCSLIKSDFFKHKKQHAYLTFNLFCLLTLPKLFVFVLALFSLSGHTLFQKE